MLGHGCNTQTERLFLLINRFDSFSCSYGESHSFLKTIQVVCCRIVPSEQNLTNTEGHLRQNTRKQERRNQSSATAESHNKPTERGGSRRVKGQAGSGPISSPTGNTDTSAHRSLEVTEFTPPAGSEGSCRWQRLYGRRATVCVCVTNN